MQRFNADGSARASPRSPSFGHAASAPKRNRISPPRPSSPWLRAIIATNSSCLLYTSPSPRD
eukprot:2031489-Alexandrium_andersonii.AAC.1